MIRSSEIESHSCVKLEQLLQILNEKFDSFPSIFKSSNKITCHCHGLGCEDRGFRDLIFSRWESRPLSARKVRYAARNTYVRILLFCSIAMGRPISKAPPSDLKVNIEQFVDPVCIRGPISKRYETIPLFSHRLGFGFVKLSISYQRLFYNTSSVLSIR